MFDRYNVELTTDYLNNVCTMGNRFGMFPTIEMIEEYNTINFRPSLIPTKETSQLMALFVEVIPSTDTPLFAINRFKKLVGYKNVLFPLSKRYPTLQEMANALMTIISAHDIANYDKFARMLQVVSEQNNIPIIFNRVESWESEKTATPNETTTIEGESSITNTTTDTIDSDNTRTKTGAVDTTDIKTGTETTTRTGTDSIARTKTGTDGINETVTEKVAPFDSNTFNNEHETSKTSATTYNTNESDNTTHNTIDTLTHNTTDTINSDITETVIDDNTTERSIANSGTTETTQTRTHTGENEEAENGKRLINTGLSMAELIEKESKLLPVFDMYLLSIAREITLSCIEEVY